MTLSRRTTLRTRMSFSIGMTFYQSTQSKCSTGIAAAAAVVGVVVFVVGGAEGVACVSGAGSVRHCALGVS
jgi:hypothetical protein